MLNLQLPEGADQFDAAAFTQDGEFLICGHREECEQKAESIGGLYCGISGGKAVIRGDFEGKLTLKNLQAAIEEFKDIAGPVIFKAEDSDGTIMLVAEYSENDSPEGAPLNDEPWKVYGGDKIIERSGLTQLDAGMDRYTDKHGDEMIEQWVTFKK